MKILLINIRYGYVGGPERYLFNLKHILEENGHSVIPFSIKYLQNEPSEYDNFFASPIADEESVFYKDQKWNLTSFVKTLDRNVYSVEIENKLSDLIDYVKPDFAIVLLYLRKLSPSVLVALNKKKVPFLVRLSDYIMICPSNNMFRDNHICELCAGGNLINSVKYKCVHNSYAASLVNYVATKYHQTKGYFDLINHFVSPSKALITKMVEDGWDPKRFSYLPTFANLPEGITFKVIERKILYAGRIEYIKGIHVLLEALQLLKARDKQTISLIIAGSGNPEYLNRLKEYCLSNNLSGVEFIGDLKKNELFEHYKSSVVSVIPSLCYDNLPNSALESLAFGTPVIAPAHGSFPEFITEGENGLLFTPGSAIDLANKIDMLINKNADYDKMRQCAVESIQLNFSAEKHYITLMGIIEKVRSKFLIR